MFEVVLLVLNVGRLFVTVENKEVLIPGIGTAGKVICPIMSIGRMIPEPCAKHACELWMEFDFSGQKIARCSLAWIPFTTVQLREELERIRTGTQKGDNEK